MCGTITYCFVSFLFQAIYTPTRRPRVPPRSRLLFHFYINKWRSSSEDRWTLPHSQYEDCVQSMGTTCWCHYKTPNQYNSSSMAIFTTSSDHHNNNYYNNHPTTHNYHEKVENVQESSQWSDEERGFDTRWWRFKGE